MRQPFSTTLNQLRAELPRPGETITQRTRTAEHPYRVIAVEPYRSAQTNELTAVLTLTGRCVVCGEPFAVSTGRNQSRALPRTCRLHRARWQPKKLGAKV